MFKKSVKAATTRVLSSIGSLPPEYADWTSILKPDLACWESARAAAKGGPRVLIANCAGIDSHVTTVESLLAVALTLRGAEVHILLCDETLPACWLPQAERISPAQFAKSGPSEELCPKCFLTGSKVFRPLGLPIHRYSDFISAKELQKAYALAKEVRVDEIEHFHLDGIQIGEEALAGTLRYYVRGDLRDEPEGEAILRRYFNAALLSAFAVRRLFTTFSFSAVCGIHGMYVPEGLIGAVARKQNVRTVSWNDAYRKHTFIFSHHDTYHRTMLSEPKRHWENLPWTQEMESQIVEYLKSRWYGTHDWIRYTQDWSEDVSSIAADLGMDFNKPWIGLLTNVIWDAQVCYGGNAFSNMLEWTLQTIKYFAHRPDLQLIVRVHPAEVRAYVRSRQPMVDEIKRALPNLPKNVFIVPPDSPMNTYAAMLKCDAVLIYGTKAGVELSSMGIPVIVAGEAWVRNKGLTLDASSADQYFALLDRLPLGERLSDEAVRQARKYAYHFFFRRLIPVPILKPGEGGSFSRLEISGIDEVLPGRYPGLDVICDGIINGDEFIYPAELYPDNLAAGGKFTISDASAIALNLKTKPLVSVIVTAHNHAASLPGLLDSVHGQNGRREEFDLEVIVIDNASVDARWEIASHYSGIEYVTLPKSSSLAVMRNIGFRASKGQYVTFLDDDNLWLPERLRSHIRILENYTEFGAAYGQFIATGIGEDTLWPDAGTAPAGSIVRALLMEEFAFLSSLTVRREVLQKAGNFDETLRGWEDYDMLLRLAFSACFAFVAGAAGKVRFSKYNPWFGRFERGEYQTELQRILNKIFALMPDNDETASLRREAIFRWVSNIARRLDEPETVELLRSHILCSIKVNPWMMGDPTSRSLILAYANKCLLHTIKGDSTVINRAIRNLCDDFRSTQSGDDGKNAFQMRHFLGDTLTQTAVDMWARGDFKAATYAATYAVRQDFTQILRQTQRASSRFVRALLPI